MSNLLTAITVLISVAVGALLVTMFERYRRPSSGTRKRLGGGHRKSFIEPKQLKK